MTTPLKVTEITPANSTHGRDAYEHVMPQRAPEVPQRRSTTVIQARRLA